MPDVRPFRGFHFNPARVKNFRAVLSPPYDVISETERQKLYRQSPHNFVRIDFRQKAAGSTAGAYADAGRELSSWIQKSVFVQDGEPAFYVLRQDFRDSKGRKAVRIGFLGLVDLDPSGIKKHENTLSGPKEDRMNLMKALQTQLSPIFLLFSDPTGKAQNALRKALKTKPLFDVELSGVRHRMNILQDAAAIDAIRSALKRRSFYIADGHHRFEVTCEYYKRHRKEGAPKAIFAYLCDGDRNDIEIDPTHRVLKDLPVGWEASLLKRADRLWRRTVCRGLDELLRKLEGAGALRVGYLGSKGFELWERKKATRDLDVMALHREIIGPLLGGESIAVSKRIRFTRDAREAAGWVRTGEGQAAFFLGKMPIRDMMRISDEGKKLPQKSTYFFPKILSGQVFFRFGR